MEVIAKIKEVLFTPEQFFSGIRKTEKDLQPALVFLLIVGAFSILASGIIWLLFSSFLENILEGMFGIGQFPPFFIGSFGSSIFIFVMIGQYLSLVAFSFVL